MSTSDAIQDPNLTEPVITGLRELVKWSVETGVENIPRQALSRAAIVVADSLAAAISTGDEPEIAGFRDFAVSRKGREEATIFGGDTPRTDRHWAAVANSMAMTTAELDGGYEKTSCHAALYTVPVLLAEAESAGVSVLDMLRAEVLAYELVARLALAWAPKGAYPPLYTHSRFSAIGSACASALVRRFDRETFLHVIGMASTLITAGPRNHLMQGALVRNIWPAAGAWNGMMSAQWAACGVTALSSSVYDVFSGVLGFAADPAPLANKLGIDWAITHGYTRMHACHLFCNSLVEVMLELRKQLMAGDALEKIDEISIEIHAEALGLHNGRPANTLEARFSLPHIAATTLVHGHASTNAFSTAAISLPAVASLREKVRIKPFDVKDAEGHRWPAAARIEAAGRSYKATCVKARGGHGDPFPPPDVWKKVDVLTAHAYPNLSRVFREASNLDPAVLCASCTQLIANACR